MAENPEVLWKPNSDLLDSSHMAMFRACINERNNIDLADYSSLHDFSLRQTGEFWSAVADYCGIVWQVRSEKPYQSPTCGKMIGAKWFAGSKLNFAENLLTTSDPNKIMITSYAEGASKKSITQKELSVSVGRCAAALQKAGVKKGDRVAGIVGNLPEAIIAMLGATALGAVWASCSPDFGTKGIVDRLSQIDPKVVFYTSSYKYGGRIHSTFDVISDCQEHFVDTQWVAVDHLGRGDKLINGAIASEDFFDIAPLFVFVPCSFDDPLYIMFSSGTTGVPKCIVHGVGGTLLQHKKELMLHSNIDHRSSLLYFTTCGWMMWNWMVSALSCDARLVLYEGSPAYPGLDVLWKVVEDEDVTALGTSPKFISSCIQNNIAPNLTSSAKLKTILSTGAPLLPEHFDWVYENCGNVHLASICGGTDILSCFMLGVPTLPVLRGEIQAPGLGMALKSFDEESRSVVGQKGELVCTQPFPSMPIGFWGDDEGEKYRKAYFDHYESSEQEVWRHGDFIEVTPSGGVVVYGRSDATLNPGGVRIGTAEIYRQVELIEEAIDSIAVGFRSGGDTEVILFVKLLSGLDLSDELISKIKSTIRSTLTPRHVPQKIISVTDIPYTRSGKKVEIAVTQAIHGEEVKNLSALANPESMDEFFEFGRSGI